MVSTERKKAAGLWLIAVVCISLSLIPQAARPQDAQPAPTSAAPQPDSSGAYRPGGEVKAPKLVHFEEADYSDEARKKKVSGVCKLSLIVGADGNPRDIQVIHSISEKLPPKLQSAGVSLDEKAKEAVQSYRFKPGTYKGEPVPVQLQVQVRFFTF